MENKNIASKQTQNDDFDVGIPQISWQTWEYMPHERSRLWFIISSVIGASLLVYSIATENYLFAIIVLMMGVILLVNSLRHPDRVDVHITDLGLVVGNHFFDYKDIKDFSIIYNPPEVKALYIDFQRIWQPLMVIQLEDTDPNAIREALLPYVFENMEREEENLTEMVRRLYKL